MTSKKQNAFHPGMEWLDTEGKPIQAHGGSIIQVKDTWYWYGENKEKTDGKNGIWTCGIRCYASKDLYNWENLGYLLAPDWEDEESPLNPLHAMLDRPHILYNDATRKYVLWVKAMRESGMQAMSIYTADTITGPYQKVREDLRPLQMNAGDFDLVKGYDGKGYIYFERVHRELICADLTEDYCGVAGYYSTHFPKPYPPFVREGVCHFEHDHRQYLITSGTTGYLPNPSEAAVGDTWHGPFRVLGNPHPEDLTNTSFHSQISCIFEVEKEEKKVLIAAADRWAPDVMDQDYQEYSKAYAECFSKDKPDTTKIAARPEWNDTHRPTCRARYVWLPIHFDGEQPVISWKDSWKWEEELS